MPAAVDMLKGMLRSGVEVADDLIASMSPRLFPEEGSILTVLFHSLFRSRSESELGTMDPQQKVTVADLRLFIEHFLASGYSFLSPDDMAGDTVPAKKGMLLTFDDGYYNNTLALDVLAEYRVPAVFFISSNHVLEGKSFWWDALFRGMSRRGRSPREIGRETRKLKKLRTAQIEDSLRAEFGSTVLEPMGDADRPFGPDELEQFARHELVHIGNHTADHAILTNYTHEEARLQIRGCQAALERLTGRRPTSIAYPNGNYSPAVVDAALAEGLSMGVTLVFRKNRMPLASGRERMSLGRFLFWGDRDLHGQCRVLRSGLVPSHLLRRMLKRGY